MSFKEGPCSTFLSEPPLVSLGFHISYPPSRDYTKLILRKHSKRTPKSCALTQFWNFYFLHATSMNEADVIKGLWYLKLRINVPLSSFGVLSRLCPYYHDLTTVPHDFLSSSRLEHSINKSCTSCAQLIWVLMVLMS